MKESTPFYKILTVFASVGIFIIVTFIAIMVPANSKAFYAWQFEKNDTLSWVRTQADYLDNEYSEDYDPYAADYVESMTEEQLQDLMMHVMRYCFYLEDDINITVDGRYLNIFRADERAHMKDVRAIFGVFIALTVLSVILCIIFLFFLFNRPRLYFEQCRKIPFITFTVLGGIFLVIALWTMLDFKFVFEVVFHNLFFKGNFAFSYGVMISMIGEIFPDLITLIGIGIPVLLAISTIALCILNNKLSKLYNTKQENIHN